MLNPGRIDEENGRKKIIKLTNVEVFQKMQGMHFQIKRTHQLPVQNSHTNVIMKFQRKKE